MIKWKLIALSSAFVLGGGAGPLQQPAAERGPAPPRLIAGSISNSDYPADAIRARAQGSTTMVIGVAADGSVADCRVSFSSGNQALDERSCAIARERFRFTPGRNAEGVAIPAQFHQSVRWVMPDPEPVPFAPSVTAITATVRDGQIGGCVFREDGKPDEMPLEECKQLFAEYPGWENLKGGLGSATHVSAFTPQGSRPPAYQPAWGQLHRQAEIDVRIGPDGRVTGCAPAGEAAFSQCPEGSDFVEAFEASGEAERRGRITLAMFIVRR